MYLLRLLVEIDIFISAILNLFIFSLAVSIFFCEIHCLTIVIILILPETKEILPTQCIQRYNEFFIRLNGTI